MVCHNLFLGLRKCFSKLLRLSHVIACHATCEIQPLRLKLFGNATTKFVNCPFIFQWSAQGETHYNHMWYIYIYIRYLFPYLCISHDNVLTCHQVQSDFNSQMQKWNMGVSSFPKKTESRTRWPRAMHHRTKYKLQRLKFEVICYSRYLQKPATKSS